MTRREFCITGTAAGLMLLGGGLAARARSWHRLGQPGVKLVAEPFWGLAPGARGTNDLVRIGKEHVDLPDQVEGFRSRILPVDSSVWRTLPEDTTYGQRIYEAPDGFSVHNSVVLMGTDRTSIHQPQYCLRGSGYSITHSESRLIRIAAPHPYDLPVVVLKVRRTVKGADGRAVEQAGVLVYWFVADGQLTSDHATRMWWMARDLVTLGVLQRWAYTLCFSPCVPGKEEPTYRRMAGFIQSTVPQYQQAPASSTA